MAFADLEADLSSIRRKPATFALWCETADEAEVNLVLSYLNDNTVPADPLVRRLRAHGIPITQETVRAHRDAR